MMYQVFYLGQPVYGPDVENCILEPKLDVELNSAGNFTFTVPVENEFLWNNIEVFKGEVVIYEEDDVIWFGRPFQIVRNWKNQKVVTCEGALSYFNDTVQATHTYDTSDHYALYKDDDYNKGFFNRIIELHNDMIRADGNTDTSRIILVGNITVDNENDIYREVDYETTAEILQQMCLDTNGGYFMLRKAIDPTDGVLKNYIDWVKEMPYRTSQKITFGRNLLDVNQDLNGSDICTVLLAFGKDDKTIANYNHYTSENDAYILPSGNGVYHNGKDSEYLIHREGYKKYGRVLKVKTWNDIVANSSGGKEQLFQKAAEWLDDQNTDILTVECDAADLHYISEDLGDGYEDEDRGKLRIGQKVTVLSPIHNINGKDLSIFKISMSLDSGAKHITMGTPPKRELTDIVKSSGGSTRGSSGTTGGGGGSDGSSGTGSVSIPVKDVQVKYPGDEKFRTVVKKKVAKIDLSEISSGVSDVRIDGTSIVNNHIANIQIDDIVKANPQTGTSVGDINTIQIGDTKYDIPSSAVADVTLDGVSIVDPNDKIAKILSDEIVEEGIEGNFEHVILPFDSPGQDSDIRIDNIPRSTYGKKTDMLVQVDESSMEYGTIIFTGKDTQLIPNFDDGNLFGGWHNLEDYDMPHVTFSNYGYPPEAFADFRYVTTERVGDEIIHTKHTIECPYVWDGSDHILHPTYGKYPNPPDPPADHTTRVTYLTGYGFASFAGGQADFIYHNPLIKIKPSKAVGIFSFRGVVVGSWNPLSNDHWDTFDSYEEWDEMNQLGILHDPDYPSSVNAFRWCSPQPTQLFFNTETIWCEGSNDGEHWERIPQTVVSGDWQTAESLTTIVFEQSKSYSYIKFTLYQHSGFLGWRCFNFFADPAADIDTIWYKMTDSSWGRLKHIPDVVANPNGTALSTLNSLLIDGSIFFIPSAPVQDVQIDSVSILDAQGVANIDSSQFGTEVEANPQTGTSVGNLTSIKIGSDKYDIPSGGGGSSVIPNPQGQPSERLIKVGINNVIYAVAEGSGGDISNDFDYTGDIQTFVAPKTTTYKLEVWGAEGGHNDGKGGYGGYSVGNIDLTQGDTLYICVGGGGTGGSTDVAGYNGGGYANHDGDWDRGAGGGATHIATATGVLSSLSSNRSAVLIVAGGGGGAGYYSSGEYGIGGSGGGYQGSRGSNYDSGHASEGGYGGTQTAGGGNGSFGQGGNRTSSSDYGGSGGGGGWFGGGSSINTSGGGGGSGYISSNLTDACMYGYNVPTSSDPTTKTVSVVSYSSTAEEKKAKSGNGFARISWGGGDLDPYVTVGDLYNACVANNVTPASHSLNDIIAEFLRVN